MTFICNYVAVAICLLFLFLKRANVLTIVIKAATPLRLSWRSHNTCMKNQTKSCYFLLENLIAPVEGKRWIRTGFKWTRRRGVKWNFKRCNRLDSLVIEQTFKKSPVGSWVPDGDRFDFCWENSESFFQVAFVIDFSWHHIHSNPRVLPISNSSLMQWRRVFCLRTSFTPEGRCLMLEGPNRR